VAWLERLNTEHHNLTATLSRSPQGAMVADTERAVVACDHASAPTPPVQV
jgi:hypothetical protein